MARWNEGTRRSIRQREAGSQKCPEAVSGKGVLAMNDDLIRSKLWADMYTYEIARGKHWLDAKESADSAVQHYDRMPAIAAQGDSNE